MTSQRHERRSGNGAGERRASLAGRNERWSLALLPLRLLGGQPLRLLLIVDEFTGQCPALRVGNRFESWDVVETLNDATRRCGLPRRLKLGPNPEFSTPELSVWAQVHHIRISYAAAAAPDVSRPMTRLQETVRQQCLNRERLTSVDQAQDVIDAWRNRFNKELEGNGNHEPIPARPGSAPISAGPPTADILRSVVANEPPTFQIDWPRTRPPD